MSSIGEKIELKEEFYQKYSEKAMAEKRAKSINSQEALKELAEVLNEVLVGRLDVIYDEREKLFQQVDHEETQFRDYDVFKYKYYGEIKHKFFEEVNIKVKNTIEDSFSNMELYMKQYFKEKKNNEIMRRNIKVVETFVILPEVKNKEAVYNLKNYKVKYFLIENERIPGLIKRE